MKISTDNLIEIAPLYQKYSFQNSPQKAYVYIDPELGEVHADWCDEIGNAVPASVFYQHKFRVNISCYANASSLKSVMTSDEATALYEKIREGYELIWNGNNHVGNLSEEAPNANKNESSHVIYDSLF